MMEERLNLLFSHSYLCFRFLPVDLSLHLSDERIGAKAEKNDTSSIFYISNMPQQVITYDVYWYM